MKIFTAILSSTIVIQVNIMLKVHCCLDIINWY